MISRTMTIIVVAWIEINDEPHYQLDSKLYKVVGQTMRSSRSSFPSVTHFHFISVAVSVHI